MSNNEQLKDLFHKRNEEASWCYSCVKRNTCTNKEAVAMEEHLAHQYILKHVKVNAECIGYIKDNRVKYNPKAYFLKQLFS